jgi:hypothetical protein
VIRRHRRQRRRNTPENGVIFPRLEGTRPAETVGMPYLDARPIPFAGNIFAFSMVGEEEKERRQASHHAASLSPSLL